MKEQNKNLVPRVAVGALSSPLEVGANRAPKAAEDLKAALAEMGMDVVELGAVDTPAKARAAGRVAAEQHVHAFAFAAACWFEDYLVLDALEEWSVPLLLWALPGMETGALCGVQQLTCYLKQLGAPYACVFGEFADVSVGQKAKTFLTAVTMKATLRRARIGLAGHRITGMTETAADEIALKKTLGPRIVPLDVPQLLTAADLASNKKARELWQDTTRCCAACKVSEAVGLDAMKVYLAVRKLVEQHELDALTVGCYPHLMGRVCLAASRLADEGIPLGCEGDVNGAVSQLLLTKLTNQPTHNTDWLDPLDAETVVFTHCGSGSFSLAERQEDITLASVRLMDQGVCALFPAKTGPVTLLSLLPSSGGYQLAMMEGEALPVDMVFPGNPVRVKFFVSPAELIDWIAAEGIGHHWMIGYGHVGETIRQWAQLCPGLRLITPA
jgi:L-fucose isomerase-like protein